MLIDLSPSEEDILMAFNQKGRHALRRAERDGGGQDEEAEEEGVHRAEGGVKRPRRVGTTIDGGCIVRLGRDG